MKLIQPQNKVSTVSLTSEEVQYTLDKADEIITNGQAFGRTRDTVIQHVSLGLIIELGLCKILDARMVSDVAFNSYDSGTFAYDLIQNGSEARIESKKINAINSTNGNLNFNLKSSKIPGVGYGAYPNLETQLKRHSELDYFSFASLKTLSDNLFEVTYAMSINATVLNNYSRKSYIQKNNSNSTHWIQSQYFEK